MLSFGQVVLLWRLHRDMSQTALARAAGITRPNLSAIERGERDITLHTLRALAQALGVKPGILADGEPPGGGPVRLSRAALERVASAAVGGAALSDPRERELASCLREITYNLRGDRNTRKARPSQRAVALTQLRLKSMVTAETLTSLVIRLTEQVELR